MAEPRPPARPPRSARQVGADLRRALPLPVTLPDDLTQLLERLGNH